MEGLKVSIRSATRPEQCTDVALKLRRFFVDNPERLSAEPQHLDFFQSYLAVLCEMTPPANAYWTEDLMRRFRADGEKLKP